MLGGLLEISGNIKSELDDFRDDQKVLMKTAAVWNGDDAEEILRRWGTFGIRKKIDKEEDKPGRR